MTMNRKWMAISLLLLSWALAASMVSGYYWLQYTDTANRISGVLITVNIAVDYGNSTRQWYNGTKALTGMTFFAVSRNVLNITYQTSTGYGAYVQSINRLEAEGTFGWIWWRWNTQAGNWTLGETSADMIYVAPDETFIWYYESGSTWPPPAPLPN